MIALKKHCRLTVNLRELPQRAFVFKEGPYGQYYQVRYDIGLVFGAAGIEFRFLYNGSIIGSVHCEYF
jgi:hypothetical protein